MTPAPDPPPSRPGLPGPAVAFIRALALPDLSAYPDGDLLRRITGRRDEAAFTELVRRHGPMVFGVCRRLLSNSADAEDATQAAFVVLDRHAARLAGRASIGDWLHGVATRTALKARTRRDRRRRVEVAAARPVHVDPVPVDDLAAVVDQAVRALPAKFRDAVVLCDLQGVPRRVAAERLGIAEGTISSRLAVAHQRLARRLARSVGVVLAALAAADGPGALAVAARWTTAGTVPAAVSVLVTEVTRAMFFTKLKLLVAAGIVAAGVAGAGVTVTRNATADDPVPAKAERPVAKAAARAERAADGMPDPTLADRDKAAREEYVPLIGVWILEVAQGGIHINAESPLHPSRIDLNLGSRFVGQAKFYFETDSVTDGPGIRTDNVAYVVNRRRTPHELTAVIRNANLSTGVNRVFAFIYEVSGERLKLAYYNDPFCTDRPHGFPPADQPAGSPPMVVLEYRLAERTQPRYDVYVNSAHRGLAPRLSDPATEPKKP